ncbi:hypothetical protein NPIL_267991, partial [Nephila pilipes]
DDGSHFVQVTYCYESRREEIKYSFPLPTTKTQVHGLRKYRPCHGSGFNLHRGEELVGGEWGPGGFPHLEPGSILKDGVKRKKRINQRDRGGRKDGFMGTLDNF